MPNHTEDAAQEAIDRASAAGKQVGGMAKQGAKKLATKVGKQAMKAVGRAVAQGVGSILVSIAPFVVPILVGALVIGGLFSTFYLIEQDSRPAVQNQQNTPQGMNETKSSGINEKVESLSPQNLVVKAFYINYSNNSYFQKMKGEDQIYHVSEQPKHNGKLIVDKYENEERFKLSPDLLWTLDEYLYEKKIRFPEGLIRPVHYDEETLEVLPLADKTDFLVESRKYTEDGNLIVNTKTPGIWDYGIAPIIIYDEFEETTRYVYHITKKEVYDPVTQTVQFVDVYEDDPIRNQFGTISENVSSENVFLIDSVVTFMGSAKSEISNEEQDTGTPAPPLKNNVVSYGPSYDIKTGKKLTKQIRTLSHPTMVVSNTPKYLSSGSGYVQVEEGRWTVVADVSMEGKYYIYELDSEGNQLQLLASFTETLDQPLVTGNITTQEYDEIVTRQLTAQYNGTIYEKKAQYINEPEIEIVEDQEYIRSYLKLFEMPVPKDAIEDFDLDKRVHENEEELKAIIEEYELKQKQNATSSDLSLSLDGTDQTTLIGLSQYDAYFVKYGEKYGIDPIILKAMAATESSGVHNPTVEDCSYKGCGLVQIEAPGQIVKGYTVYQFTDESGKPYDTPQRVTKKIGIKMDGLDTLTSVCAGVEPENCLNVYDVEKNIEAAAVAFRNRLEAYNNNVFMAIQSYNYGQGGFNIVLNLYQSATGISPEVAMTDYNNLSWTAHLEQVHRDPCNLGIKDWCGKVGKDGKQATFGTPTHLFKVVSYFPTNSVVYVLDANRNPIEFSTDIEGVERNEDGMIVNIISSIGSSIGNALQSVGKFFVNAWDKMGDLFGTLFGTRIDYLNKIPTSNVEFVESHLTASDIDSLITMIIAFDEETYISNVTTDPDAQAKLLFNSVFATGNGDLNAPENDRVADPYFEEDSSSPLVGSTTIVEKFSSNLHPGIDISAPNGSSVISIAKGQVIEVGVSDDPHIGNYVKIDHGDGGKGYRVVAVYGRLDASSIKVSVGDTVAKSQQFATVGKQAGDSEDQKGIFHFELWVAHTPGDENNLSPVDPSYLFQSNEIGNAPTVDGNTFGWPIDKGYITCYGFCPGYTAFNSHEGVDFGNGGDTNTNILATNDGVVMEVSNPSYPSSSASSYGRQVMIKHTLSDGSNVYTHYAHLSKIASGLEVGDTVKKGTIIGKMGGTGTTMTSFAVHLHYGVYNSQKKSASTVLDAKYYLPFTEEQRSKMKWSVSGSRSVNPYDAYGPNRINISAVGIPFR